MINAIKKSLGLCTQHDYETVFNTHVDCHDDFGYSTYRVKTFMCKKCGKVKRVKSH